jgi:uncharacterized protein YdgA (DUF945 family)
VNRWFVAAIVTLALIVLVSPGIVGRLAERSVEENLNFAASESDELVVTTESFERGWFTSEGRHRIELGKGAVRTLFETNPSAQVPSLIVETHVDHGLLPVTSLSRESGSLMPGLASTVSTLKFDAGNGEIFEVPGKIYSQVGLTGETTSRFQLEAGSTDVEAARLAWQGADVTVQTNPQAGSVSFEGEVSPFSFLDEDGGFEFGRIAVDGQQNRTPFGFNVGTIHVELESVAINSVANPAMQFGPLAIDAKSDIDGDKVNASTKFTISSVPTPGLGDVDIALDLALDRVDARSFQKIAAAVRNAQASADSQQAIQSMYPLVEDDVQKILSSGLEIRFDQFDISSPSGELTTKFQFSLPPTDSDADFSWSALLLALDASADVRLPVALYEMAELMSPDVGMLVAMGIFKKDGEYYEMKAEYSQGLVTVNGVPMPIPIQGL